MAVLSQKSRNVADTPIQELQFKSYAKISEENLPGEISAEFFVILSKTKERKIYFCSFCERCAHGLRVTNFQRRAP